MENEIVNPVDVAYISTACNRSPSCADWNSDNIICFAATNSVALLDTNYDGSAKITETLVLHTDKVTCVRWIKSDTQSDLEDIVSGSLDGSAIIWSNRNNGTYEPLHHLPGHIGGVAVADARYFKGPNEDKLLYIATVSMDSKINIWVKKEMHNEVTLQQTISLNTGICITLQLFNLPLGNVPIMACALDDSKIHLYIERYNEDSKSFFDRVDVLVGHEDWVCGLDFVSFDDTVMLASCSQDTHIRLWSIEPHVKVLKTNKNNEVLKVERKVFTCNNTHWAVSLNAVLSGHEGWVYGVHWNYNSKAQSNRLKLLSSSIDKTLIIWEPDTTDGTEGVWIERIRVGEVGGSGLGFYGGKFSKDGNSIMGHGYAGSFHIWKRKEETDSWDPAVICGGHFGEVIDIGWEPKGQFLVSISTDQTTRIHAPWTRKNASKITWHELARPQIHGFDLSCLAIISRFSFASGAEEKVIRTFQAPSNFIKNFQRICAIENVDDSLGGICQGASVPSLGLSNKAVFSSGKPENTEERHVKDIYPDNYFVPVDLQEPPTEETLMQNTLWPEMHKLYGHGYEVFSLAASNDGMLLASACKATTAQHAAILIWDTSSWVQIQSLSSHQLTITQLSFSHDSQSLLSVSRDRRWSVFERNVSNQFTLVGTTDKSNGIHTRIIWCCAWTHDSKYFFTGSREGKIVMWGKSKIPSESSMGPYSNVIPALELKSHSVTALAVAPNILANQYIIAVGVELGMILLYQINQTSPGNEWQLLFTLNKSVAHHLTVKKLSFRPNNTKKDADSSLIQLASCSCDHSVKIYELKF